MATVASLNAHPAQPILKAVNAAKGNILFPVARRPLAMVGQGGATAAVAGHQAVARMMGDKPVCLGVVSDSYGLVKNADVLPKVEAELMRHLPARAWDKAKITDQQSYSGAWTSRRYVFQGFQSVVTTNLKGFETRACLQFEFRNGYDGSTTLFLGGGLLDLICTNGLMGIRWQENVAKRHTKSAVDYPYEEIVLKVIHRYEAEVARLTELGHHPVTDAQVREFLDANFAKRRADALMGQYQTEKHFRGANAFALLSALTFFSSHDEGSFRVRRVGANDNVFATLARRGDEVAELVASPKWATFLNAAA